jgi:hypothetical protein
MVAADAALPVSVRILGDMFVVRCVKRGMKLEGVFEKTVLVKLGYTD